MRGQAAVGETGESAKRREWRQRGRWEGRGAELRLCTTLPQITWGRPGSPHSSKEIVSARKVLSLGGLGDLPPPFVLARGRDGGGASFTTLQNVKQDPFLRGPGQRMCPGDTKVSMHRYVDKPWGYY